MICRDIVTPAENYIMKSRDTEVQRWHTHIDGEQSCVGFAQVFSDKTRFNLTIDAFKMYPLHICLMNFAEVARQK